MTISLKKRLELKKIQLKLKKKEEEIIHQRCNLAIALGAIWLMTILLFKLSF